MLTFWITLFVSIVLASPLTALVIWNTHGINIFDTTPGQLKDAVVHLYFGFAFMVAGIFLASLKHLTSGLKRKHVNISIFLLIIATGNFIISYSSFLWFEAWMSI